MLTEAELKKLIGDKIHKVLSPVLHEKKPTIVESLKETVKTTTKELIKEAVVLIPKTFNLKTEFLSQFTKENHFNLYKNYISSFNQISAKLDSILRTDADNPTNSDFRRLKLDEQHNLNGVKLHELYFNNISDLSSEIRMDSIPYIRLANFWGTFEAWQFDFRACGMAATEGWAILYWDAFKQRYMNTFVEKHSENVPVCGIPVLVIDTWHHAWFKDHAENKQNYLNAMMKEINWSVVEARMAIAEMTNLNHLFMVEPVSNALPQQVKIMPSNQPPIDKSQIAAKISTGNSPLSHEQIPPK